MSGKWHTEQVTTTEAAHGDRDFIKAGVLSSGVREIIQGPIDHSQKNGQSTVNMTFRFESLEGEAPMEYLDKGGTDTWLTQMTQSETTGHRKALPVLDEDGGVLGQFDPLRVLHVEDDLHIGIQGRHDQFDPTEEGGFFDSLSQSNIFLFLFRVIASSMNRKGTGGSWGLGKYATYLLSKFRTAFHVSTYKHEDGTMRRFALGQAHWKSRRMRPARDTPPALIGEDGRVSYGPTIWYGKSELAVDQDPKTWLPLVEADEVDNLCSALGIHRPPDRGGTSIMIPAPQDELTGNSIAQAVLANYAIAIAKGMLTVRIVDGDYDILLDSESIREVAQ